MTDDQLGTKLDKTIRLDRKITHQVLVLINEAADRKLYAKRGFSTMKRWLVKRFHFSDAAAYQRINAAQLLRAAPQAGEKFVNGEVNLSTMNIAQKVMREHESNTDQKLSDQDKHQVLKEIENKSAWEAEASLLKIFPSVTLEPKHEQQKNVDGETIRVSANFKRETINQIEEIRKQHGINGGFAEVVTFMAKNAAPKKCRAHDRTCQYQDSVTGQICGADNWLQEDHIIPVALGGSDAPENKRWLCSAHNQLEAKAKLGVLADYRGPSTRRLQLKAANRIAAFRAEILKEFTRFH